MIRLPQFPGILFSNDRILGEPIPNEFADDRLRTIIGNGHRAPVTLHEGDFSDEIPLDLLT
ncbi:MAG: hypothetical protein MUO29_08345 [Desulfobacterales bacterium]|nr:hypothetical protein [Desulfobacterales bacterium]